MLENQTNPQIAILGGGSWATALVKIVSEQGIKVHWWLRNQAAADHIRQFFHNPNYLSNVEIKPSVQIHQHKQSAIEAAEYVIIAIPAAFVKGAMEELHPQDFNQKKIVSAIKGMIPEVNRLVTDFFQTTFRPREVLAIAGPSHAEEIAQEKTSFLTISAASTTEARSLAKILQNRYVHTMTNTDIIGVEYCAVLKNIVALAGGICHGLNYGDNFKAVLVSNAMREMARFIQQIDPRPRELLASVYLGDLLVTAYSQFSRNRNFGNMIGRGYSVQSAQMEMNMIAEGYYAVKSIQEINQALKVDLPITDAVYRILYEKAAARLEMQKLEVKFL